MRRKMNSLFAALAVCSIAISVAGCTDSNSRPSWASSNPPPRNRSGSSPGPRLAALPKNANESASDIDPLPVDDAVEREWKAFLEELEQRRKLKEEELTLVKKERKAQVEQERRAFEALTLEYQAAQRLSFARDLQASEKKARLEKRLSEYDRLHAKLEERLSGIVREYPGTQAAYDAEQGLSGADIPVRAMPPVPKTPANANARKAGIEIPESPPELAWIEVETDEEIKAGSESQGADWTHIAEAGDRRPINVFATGSFRHTPTRLWILLRHQDARSVIGQDGGSAPKFYMPGSNRTVYVRSYYRHDGTFVHSHYRSPPGNGHSSASARSASHKSSAGGRRK